MKNAAFRFGAAFFFAFCPEKRKRVAATRFFTCFGQKKPLNWKTNFNGTAASGG